MSQVLCSVPEVECKHFVSFFKLYFILEYSRSLVAQMVKNLLAMQETGVGSLSGEDTLVEEMATHSSILD